MAHAESITFQKFRTRFSTEDACRRNYSGFGIRTALSARNAAVRNITRFAGETRSSAAPASIKRPSRPGLPLTAWFWAIYPCATDKRGISTVQLSRTLNICYESAWYGCLYS